MTQKQGGQQAAGAVLPLLPSLLQLGSGLPRQIDQPMIRRQAGAGRRAVPRQAGQSARVPAEQPLRAKGDEQPATGWLSYAAGLMELAGINHGGAGSGKGKHLPVNDENARALPAIAHLQRVVVVQILNGVGQGLIDRPVDKPRLVSEQILKGGVFDAIRIGNGAILHRITPFLRRNHRNSGVC